LVTLRALVMAEEREPGRHRAYPDIRWHCEEFCKLNKLPYVDRYTLPTLPIPMRQFKMLDYAADWVDPIVPPKRSPLPEAEQVGDETDQVRKREKERYSEQLERSMRELESLGQLLWYLVLRLKGKMGKQEGA
jgi:hypothetical protein